MNFILLQKYNTYEPNHRSQNTSISKRNILKEVTGDTMSSLFDLKSKDKIINYDSCSRDTKVSLLRGKYGSLRGSQDDKRVEGGGYLYPHRLLSLTSRTPLFYEVYEQSTTGTLDKKSQQYQVHRHYCEYFFYFSGASVPSLSMTGRENRMILLC